MFNWLVKKILNQAIKLEGYFYTVKLNRFKKQFKACGENTFIQFPVRLEGLKHIVVGKNVSINAFVHMWGHGGIIIGNDCLIASHVSINSVTHGTNTSLFRESIVEKQVQIGDNVWIGSHVVILPGVTIGDNVIIGACAMVNKDVPSGMVVAGVPAQPLKTNS